MDTEKTQLFIKLAETGNFSRTAQLCHISASKLSRVIQNLEQELGVNLFERNNRQVSLTPHGIQFLSFARKQVLQWETFQDAIKSEAGELSGSVSIYCSVTASYSFLYDMLAKCRSQYPFIQIKLHTGDPADAIKRVKNGQEDIAIAAKPDALSSELAFKQFDTSPLIFIVSTEDRSFDEIALEHGDAGWSKIPLILSERGLSRERFNSWAADMGFTPNIYSQVSGNEAIVSMVSLGCGVGLIPQIVVDNSPLAKRVRPFCLQANIEDYEVGACVQNSRLKSPLVKALWELIQ